MILDSVSFTKPCNCSSLIRHVSFGGGFPVKKLISGYTHGYKNGYIVWKIRMKGTSFGDTSQM